MSWGATFTNLAASGSRSPRYFLDGVLGGSSTLGADLALSSHPSGGYTVAILASQSSISWGATGPPTWQTSPAVLRLAVDPDVFDMTGVEQGLLLRLSVQLGATTETVFIGALRNVSWELRGVAVLEIVGLEGALFNTYDGNDVFGGGFGLAGSTAEIPAATTYTPGDLTLYVDMATLDLEAGDSGLYVVRVEPTGGGFFYLQGTAWDKAAGELTGVAPTGAFDTTPVTAGPGAVVTAVAYDEGHPIDLLSQCLDDTSSTAWPSTWSMSLPSGVYDRTVCDAEVAAYGLGADDAAWKMRVEARVDRFADLLLPMASDAGVVLTQRHGKLVARVVRNPASYTPALTVTDGMLIDASWSAWGSQPPARNFIVRDRIGRDPIRLNVASDANTAYDVVQMIYRTQGREPLPPIEYLGASGLASDTSIGAHARPWQYVYEVRVPVYGGSPGPGSSASRTAWRTDLLDRLAPWAIGRPERLTITLPGWLPYAIGEAITIDSASLIRGRSGGGESYSSYVGTTAIIVGGGPDFFGATTTYECLTVPDGAPT
jgi:hypothetical protein